jgi:hypothetical protein
MRHLAAPVVLVAENFSKWKLAGVVPVLSSQARTASTIGTGPQR